MQHEHTWLQTKMKHAHPYMACQTQSMNSHLSLSLYCLLCDAASCVALHILRLYLCLMLLGVSLCLSHCVSVHLCMYLSLDLSLRCSHPVSLTKKLGQSHTTNASRHDFEGCSTSCMHAHYTASCLRATNRIQKPWNRGRPGIVRGFHLLALPKG